MRIQMHPAKLYRSCNSLIAALDHRGASHTPESLVCLLLIKCRKDASPVAFNSHTRHGRLPPLPRKPAAAHETGKLLEVLWMNNLGPSTNSSRLIIHDLESSHPTYREHSSSELKRLFPFLEDYHASTT
jgi:hypothetical protein